MSEDKKYATLVSNTILFAISNFSSKLVSLFIQPYPDLCAGQPRRAGRDQDDAQASPTC